MSKGISVIALEKIRAKIVKYLDDIYLNGSYAPKPEYSFEEYNLYVSNRGKNITIDDGVEFVIPKPIAITSIKVLESTESITPIDMALANFNAALCGDEPPYSLNWEGQQELLKLQNEYRGKPSDNTRKGVSIFAQYESCDKSSDNTRKGVSIFAQYEPRNCSDSWNPFQCNVSSGPIPMELS